jgi:large subunit ribosomal protein L19
MINNQEILKKIQNKFLNVNLPSIKVGDTLQIGIKILEGSKERIQYFEGIVISKKNTLINTTIIVRKIVQGIGIERIFLIHSPQIHSIKILRSSKVRRSKLYYLRNLNGKSGRLKQIF